MAITCPTSMEMAAAAMAATAVVSIIISVVGLLTLNHIFPLLFMKLNLPKGTFGWPLLGETLSFLKPHPSHSLGSFLSHHCSRYGKVFKTHLFMSPTIVSCDEELNYYILQNEGKIFECSYPKSIHGVLGGSSMLVAVGETHKRLRNVSLSLVNIAKSSPSFLLHIQLTALQILRSWKVPKSSILFSNEARKFTFGVIAKQVLGLTAEEAETQRILEDFMSFMRGLISLPLYIPGTPYARAVQARRRISSTVKGIIEERRRRRKVKRGEKNINQIREDEKEQKNSKKSDIDFLEILLEIESLSDDEKVSFVLDSLLGGYETTSLLISIVVHFLAHSPNALEQLKIEHENIRRTKEKDEFLTWEDYREMNFTHNVINEALRCGNIVKFVHRKALKDVEFKGYVIPAGWKILPVFTAVHLDPSLHEHAHTFQPWRWEKQDHQTCKKFTPFGGGSRCCPGSELARVEVAFFLHYLVLNFRWKVEEDDQPIAYPYVEFKRGLRLHVEQIST